MTLEQAKKYIAEGRPGEVVMLSADSAVKIPKELVNLTWLYATKANKYILK